MHDRSINRVRFKKTVLIVAVNLGLLAVFLFLAEAALRIARIPYKEDFVPTENAVARFDKDLGWSYVPNLTKEITYGSNTRTLHFDGNGIRVPAPGFRLSPTRPSALFIGCSFTMGHGLSYEESFPAQFEALTRGAYQAINLGVQAYGTDQALLALKKFAPRFNTKVVVYTFIEDHIYRNSNYDRRYLYPDAKILGTKPLFALGPNDMPYLAKTPVLYKDYRNSYLYDLLAMKLENLSGTRPPHSEELTKALIREMRRYCSEHGIRFVLVNWRWHAYEYDDLTDVIADRIDTLAGAPVGWEAMLIPREDHPNAGADKRVARLLYTYFKTNRLLQR